MAPNEFNVLYASLKEGRAVDAWLILSVARQGELAQEKENRIGF